MRRSITITTLLAVLASASAANAGSLGKPCTSEPQAKWMPLAAIEKAVTAQGFTVRSAKIKKACAEVYAVDAKGAQVELFLDPATGTIVGRQ